MSREIDIAWGAGPYEGEGTMYLVNKKRWPVVQLNMTDREPVERMHRTWGGTLYGPYTNPKKPHHKPLYRWSLTGRERIEAFLADVMPFLSPRRRARRVA